MSGVKKTMLAIRTAAVAYLINILNIYILNSDFLKNMPDMLGVTWYILLAVLLVQLGVAVLAVPTLSFLMWPSSNEYEGSYFFLVGVVEFAILYLSLEILTNVIPSDVGGLIGDVATLGMFGSCLLTVLTGIVIGLLNSTKK